MKKFIALVFATITFAPIGLFADVATEPATAPATAPTFAPNSPREALKRFDEALPAGGMQAALAAYAADDEADKAVAKAMAAVDLVTSRLQSAVKQKYGPEAEDALLHAARNSTLTDLAEAEEKIDGDRAIIRFKGKLGPVGMTKVGGEWKVSVADTLKLNNVNGDDVANDCQQIAVELGKTEKAMKDGQLPNLELLTRDVKQRMYRILGEE